MAEVTRLRVEEVAVEQPTRPPQPTIAPAPQIEAARPSIPAIEEPQVFFSPPRYTPSPKSPTDEAMEAAFRAVGFALSARALLLLALIGAFVLAVMAMIGPVDRLWVLCAYCCLMVIPLVFLEVRKGR